ncbi:MAG TPA: AAA family ATPase [Nocardioides sp.]|jgi:DNA-binding CsgD family transcriptional regulator|nr:AAA family ATPase [Nocardioides sp.]
MPSLYERTGETASIDAALERLDEGRGSCLLLEGRAGRGKSTLVEYAVQRARERGAQTLVARARHLTSAAPFEVLRRLLGPAVEEAGGVEALDGAARFAIPLFTPGADLSQGVDYGCQWLIAWLAERAPLVLAVDDAHWADGASLRVLLDVQAEIAYQRVTMVIASRPVENPEVQRLLAAMAAQPDCEVLAPAALSRKAVGELVVERLGRPVADDFVDECVKVSRGNAFYLTELLRPFEADVRPDQKAFVRNGTLSLRRTVSWRLGELGPGAAALAQAAAILGDGCSLQQAAELARLEGAVAVSEAARLEVASIFAHGDPVEFLHPLLRAAVEAELPDVMAGELHARAARILWYTGEDPGSVAQHLVASPGSGDSAVSAYLSEQGRVALDAGSVGVATRLLKRALDEPAPPEQRDDILLSLGRAEHRALDLEAAGEHLNAAFESGDRGVALQAAADLFDLVDDANLYDDVGRIHEGALALRPFGDSEAEVILRACLLINVIMGVDVGIGELPAPLAHVDAGTLPTDRDVDRHLVVWAAVFGRSRHGGSTERLMVELRHALASLPASPDEFTLWDARAALAAAVFLADDDLDESDAVLAGLVAPVAARLAGVRPQLQAELDHRQIMHAISRGSFEDAVAQIDAAAEFTARHGVIGFEDLRRFARGRIALDQGDYPLAASLLGERATEDPVFPALGALLAGDPGRAIEMLDQLELSIEPGSSLRQIEVELQPHLLASHVHGVLGDRVTAAAEARRELEIRRRYGSAMRLAEALRRAATFLPAREGVDLLAEATEVARSTPGRPVQARVMTSYGAALRVVGRVSEARDVLARATDLASEMGMDRVLRRAQHELLLSGSRPRRARLTGPTSLTESQRHVAVLAAQGLTNRQIAERLFVTIKTVETHLMAVYRKLGIGSREELAPALRGPGAAEVEEEPSFTVP